MPDSILSIPTTVADVPEVESFSSRFYYKFFTSNELTTEGPGGYRANINIASDTNFIRTVPRYIKLLWAQSPNPSSRRENFSNIRISDHIDSIYDEETFSIKYFSLFQQQELSFTNLGISYLSNLYRILNTNSANQSLMDALNVVHESTPEYVDQEFLSRYFDYSNSSLTHTDSIYTRNNNFERIQTNASINNYLYADIFFEKLSNDSLTPGTIDGSNRLNNLFATQQSLLGIPNRMASSTYTILIDRAVSVVNVSTASDIVRYKLIGFIIKRYQIINEQRVEQKTFIIESSETNEFIDTEIKYNQTYFYDIKKVYAVAINLIDINRSSITEATYLIASKNVTTHVETVDNRPASPPTDFFINWDYGLNKPVLTWNYPIDSRRHIKYFQVFRRRNIGQTRPIKLPFELVRMYDINDLQTAENIFYRSDNNTFSFINGEGNIDKSLVIKESDITNNAPFSPLCYIDEEFDKEGYYIYTIAAIDAHGISTNYTNQIGISFNKQKNTIDRVDISAPNAPKPYPNLFLNKDTFVDTIKNEGYSQFTIVFNPEYYQLNGSIPSTAEGTPRTQDYNLFKFGPDNLYRLQLINLDLQSDQFIDFKIQDQRT